MLHCFVYLFSGEKNINRNQPMKNPKPHCLLHFAIYLYFPDIFPNFSSALNFGNDNFRNILPELLYSQMQNFVILRTIIKVYFTEKIKIRQIRKI